MAEGRMIGSVAGMMTEYNPLHAGHIRLMEETRRRLGPDAAIVCCMSGDFVQRGDMAIVRRQARAKAAVLSGADLVLELPLPWAVSSAEGFAEGGVGLLLAAGVVDTLVFGSECGDTAAIEEAASVLLRQDFFAALRRELSAGISYPAARQRAVEQLGGHSVSAALSRPNDILGVEYCKSLLRRKARIRPMAIVREGAGHGQTVEQGLPSAGMIRNLLRAGEREKGISLMAPAMRVCYEEEEAAGRAPVFYGTVERAILARLRSMGREEFAALDEGREGLYHRLYRASRDAVSVREVLERAKTKRYPMARLRRMVLWACLGLEPARYPPAPLYIRPLAMNGTGRTLLAKMRTCASLPVVVRAGEARKLSEESRALLELEARSADLYALASPALTAGRGGAVWKEGPWVAPPLERSGP